MSSICRKDSYELDYCYEQHEEIDRIYSIEIKPLVLDLFEGRNASVIALGAKGSGKTYTIQVFSFLYVFAVLLLFSSLHMMSVVPLLLK